MKIRKKMSGGNADDMRIGDILCENVSFKFHMKVIHVIHVKVLLLSLQRIYDSLQL